MPVETHALRKTLPRSLNNIRGLHIQENWLQLQIQKAALPQPPKDYLLAMKRAWYLKSP